MSRVHAIVLADLNGSISHWDSGAEQLFGYSANEAIGQSLDLIVPPEFREKHWSGFRSVVSTQVGKLDGQAISVPVLCKDGETRAFPGRFVFLRGARDDVIGFGGLYSERAGSEEPFGPILPL
jgi:PAS domain S-box-containing protein